MANAVRPPPLRSSTEKRTRLTLSPPAASSDISRSLNTTTIATRRTSRTGPLLVLGDDERTVRPLPDTPAPAAPPPPRASSRKRPACDATPDPRPPTKVSRTPHGDLYRNTNGVVQPLAVAEHDAPPAGHGAAPAGPAPQPAGADKLAVPAPAASQAKDKRSLRSQDGGSRLKSDLAVYFSNYDDIIAGASQPAGTFPCPAWWRVLSNTRMQRTCSTSPRPST